MAVVYTVNKCVKYSHTPTALELVLIPIFILVVASVPFLHMALYRYLSGRLHKGEDPE